MTWKYIIFFVTGMMTTGFVSIALLQLKAIKAHNAYLREKNKKLGETLQLKCNEVENLRKRINQTYNKPIF